ncbi:hypothetical protein QOT17_019160 [Balamuthia mandrillaris]
MEMYENNNSNKKKKKQRPPVYRTYCIEHSKELREKRQLEMLFRPSAIAEKDGSHSALIKQNAKERCFALMKKKDEVSTKVNEGVLEKIYGYWLYKRKRMDASYSSFLIRRLDVRAKDLVKEEQVLALTLTTTRDRENNEKTPRRKQRGRPSNRKQTPTNEQKQANEQEGKGGAAEEIEKHHKKEDEENEEEVSGKTLTPMRRAMLKTRHPVSEMKKEEASYVSSLIEEYAEMRRLRQQFDVARLLVDMCRKRETHKKKRIELMLQIFEQQLLEEEKDNKENIAHGINEEREKTKEKEENEHKQSTKVSGHNVQVKKVNMNKRNEDTESRTVAPGQSNKAALPTKKPTSAQLHQSSIRSFFAPELRPPLLGQNQPENRNGWKHEGTEANKTKVVHQ